MHEKLRGNNLSSVRSNQSADGHRLLLLRVGGGVALREILVRAPGLYGKFADAGLPSLSENFNDAAEVFADHLRKTEGPLMSPDHRMVLKVRQIIERWNRGDNWPHDSDYLREISEAVRHE